MKTGYKFFNKFCVALLCLFLLGCEILAENGQVNESQSGRSAAFANNAAPIGSPLVSANDSLLAMLRYSRFINGLPKEQLERERKRVNDAYFLRPNNRSGLKRAMLLMVPGTNFYDLYQATQIFTEILNSGDSSVPAFIEFAGFMLSIVGVTEQATKRHSELQEQLNQEILIRRRVEQKLEALKSIEENMTQRRGQ